MFRYTSTYKLIIYLIHTVQIPAALIESDKPNEELALIGLGFHMSWYLSGSPPWLCVAEGLIWCGIQAQTVAQMHGDYKKYLGPVGILLKRAT